MRMASFVRNKFNVMLGVATITMSVNYIVMLSGSVIVGNLVGPVGLAGVNVCTPVFAIAGFLASILSVGTGLVFSQAMGAFDDRKAAGVFTQSALLAVGIGAFIFVAMQLGGTAFFDFTGVTGAIRAEAESYWRWQSVAMALNPMVLLLEALVYADGDAKLATAAGVCHVSGSIGFSILFTRLMGNAGGAAAGTAVTMLIVLSVASLHFLRVNNHLRYRPYFCWKDLGKVCAASMPDASVYGCWGLLILIVNKFTIANFSDGLLPLVALAASVTEFAIVFDGVGEAIIPIGGMYDGEGNDLALRELANHSALMATLEGVFCGVLFFVFAEPLAYAYGIRGDAAALLPQAKEIIRTLAVAMPFMGFLMMVNTHFLVVHHIGFAVSVTVVKDFVLPTLLSLALGSTPLGFRGIWIGFAVGYLLSSIYPFAWVWFRYRHDRFPWLVKRSDGRMDDFSIRLSAEDLQGARDRAEEFLRRHSVPELIVNRVMLTIEETGMATIARNAGKSVICEFFLSMRKAGFVRLVMRDTGVSFDVARDTVFLQSIAERRYLNTLNCNRSEYYFKF